MLALVADIGGTNVRFALAEKDKISQEKVLQVKDYTRPQDAIKAYLKETGAKPSRACLAVACPVHTHPIQLTNSHWQFFRSSLQKEFGLEELKIINDFTALALAVPLLGKDDYVKFGSGKVREHKPIGVLGPGTGLGMSGMVHSGHRWIPLQGEGGHISFAPQTELEQEVAKILRQELPRISAERILTGEGVQRLYRALCIINNKPALNLSSHEIAEKAIAKSDDSCRLALDFFASALGDVAGDLALMLGAFGGIYIGGGIVHDHFEYFIESPLRQRFENKGRFDSYMRDIPTFLIKAKLSALKGCALAITEDLG